MMSSKGHHHEDHRVKAIRRALRRERRAAQAEGRYEDASYWGNLLADLNDYVSSVEEREWDLQGWAIRNPGFSDDMIGWLPDDFDDDEDEGDDE